MMPYVAFGNYERGVGGMAENEEDQLLPVSEVAKRFSVSDQTIYRWIDEGILPVVKVRRLLRIRSSDVDRLLEEASQPARTQAGGWSDTPPEGRRMR
jgi:excisionase family DNA binding protein